MVKRFTLLNNKWFIKNKLSFRGCPSLWNKASIHSKRRLRFQPPTFSERSTRIIDTVLLMHTYPNNSLRQKSSSKRTSSTTNSKAYTPHLRWLDPLKSFQHWSRTYLIQICCRGPIDSRRVSSIFMAPALRLKVSSTALKTHDSELGTKRMELLPYFPHRLVRILISLTSYRSRPPYQNLNSKPWPI
jgi:hypothetical protein